MLPNYLSWSPQYPYANSGCQCWWLVVVLLLLCVLLALTLIWWWECVLFVLVLPPWLLYCGRPANSNKYLSGWSSQSAALSLTLRCRSASFTCHFLMSSCVSRCVVSPQPHTSMVVRVYGILRYSICNKTKLATQITWMLCGTVYSSSYSYFLLVHLIVNDA